jgi:hypothetical protein
MWTAWAQLFSMVLGRRRGDQPAPVEPTILLQSDSLATFDSSLIDAAGVARARAGLAGWANPEMLRAAAVGLGKSKRAHTTAEAHALLERGLAEAKAQGALAWELRIATTMAEMYLAQHAAGAGLAVLEPIYERLPEGFETADALAARDLLETLGR